METPVKDTLYFGGDILTLEPGLHAEALLVRGERILALGTADELRALSPQADRVDLAGRALLPAFIDAHSHLSAMANRLLQVPLADADSFEEIRRRIAAFVADNGVQPGAWVIASGYDHNALAERRHPTLALLDAAAPDNPLLLQHQSGHMGVFNSRALVRLGVTPDTPAPAGGRIGLADGQLTGYMEEAAFLAFQQQVPLPDLQALTGAFVRAQRCYAAHGIATVQEGLLPEQLFPVYQALLQRSLLTLDTVAYPSPEAFDRACALFPSSGYERHLRIGGMKIFLDGSPQGRTAWLRAPYAGSGDCGYGTMTDAQVEGALRLAAARGVQLLAHCNGDAAAAQFLRAVRAVSAEYPNFAALRSVMIHAQLLGLDQLEEVRALGILPSFFVAHVYHFGDVHLQNLGVSRAAALSPARSALQAGIRFTFHQDAPVIEPDMLETLWCATCRRTRAGVWLGPDQAIGTEDALRAVTADAAYQYFEEGTKGTLRPGKRADLVLLSGNPLTTPPEDLRSLQVEATIRGGETVYRR